MTDAEAEYANALADEISTCHVTVRYEGVEEATELDLFEKTLIVRALRRLADPAPTPADLREPAEAMIGRATR